MATWSKVLTSSGVEGGDLASLSGVSTGWVLQTTDAGVISWVEQSGGITNIADDSTLSLIHI